MWMMPLHLHVNQKSDYDDDDSPLSICWALDLIICLFSFSCLMSFSWIFKFSRFFILFSFKLFSISVMESIKYFSFLFLSLCL